ncbi:MAG: hypothetical protein LBU04_07660 [Christensenellaceae bacterium]|jgi:hypothetical protein|nr:hypothetical protein [Christensenellaceae bacterium]
MSSLSKDTLKKTIYKLLLILIVAGILVVGMTFALLNYDRELDFHVLAYTTNKDSALSPDIEVVTIVGGAEISINASSGRELQQLAFVSGSYKYTYTYNALSTPKMSINELQENSTQSLSGNSAIYTITQNGVYNLVVTDNAGEETLISDLNVRHVPILINEDESRPFSGSGQAVVASFFLHEIVSQGDNIDTGIVTLATLNEKLSSFNAIGANAYTTVVTYDGSSTVKSTVKLSGVNVVPYTTVITANPKNSSAPIIKTINFTITKATPVLDYVYQLLYFDDSNSTPIGKLFQFNNLAKNENAATPLTVFGDYTWTDPIISSEVPYFNYGGNTTQTLDFDKISNTAYQILEYYYSFTPQDKTNYVSVVYGKFILDLRLGLVLGVAQRSGGSGSSDYFVEIDTSVKARDPEITISATSQTTDSMMRFAGWKRSDSSTYLPEDSSRNLDWSLSASDKTNAYKSAFSVSALFVETRLQSSSGKYQSEDGVFNIPSIGDEIEISVEFASSIAAFNTDITVSNIELVVSGGTNTNAIVENIGSYQIYVKLTVSNGTQSYPIWESTVAVNVTIGLVQTIPQQSSITEWSSSRSYGLIAEFSQNSINKFYYSLDNKTTWIGITGDPGVYNQIQFNASAIIGSGEFDIVFAGTSASGGSTIGDRSDIVAISAVVHHKVDAITPIVTVTSSFVDLSTYVGEWTNKDIMFTFNVTMGGSGGRLLYQLGTEIKELEGIQWVNNEGLEELNSWNGTPLVRTGTYTLSTEGAASYRFRFNSNLNAYSNYTNAVDVKIDKTAPVANHVLRRNVSLDGEISEPQDAAQGEWLNLTQRLSFTATEIGSGIASFNLFKNGVMSTIALTNDVYNVLISDYSTFTINLSDNAGNVTSIINNYKDPYGSIHPSVTQICERVDAYLPAIERVSSSYIAGSWTQSSSISVLLNLTYGVTGANVYYSKGNNTQSATWVFLDEFDFDDTSLTHTSGLSTITETLEGSYILYLKITSGAGLEKIHTFGEINIDRSAPVILDYTNNGWDTNLENATLQWIYPNFRYAFTVADGGVINTATITGGGTVYVSETDSKRFFTTLTQNIEYKITIIDGAGNSVEKTFTPLIENPNMAINSLSLFYESDSSAYDSSTWAITPLLLTINYSNLSNNTGVFFETATRSDFSTWKRENETAVMDVGSTLTRNIRLVSDHIGYMYIRLVSGSGKLLASVESAYIKLDTTLPSFEFFSFVYGGTNYNETQITSIWRSTANGNAINVTANSSDQTSQIASFTVKSFPATATDFSTGGSDVAVIAISGYQFFMDDYLKYVIRVSDNAGNVFLHVVLPLIDNANNFSLNIVKDIPTGWITGLNASASIDFSIDGSFGPSGSPWIEWHSGNGVWSALVSTSFETFISQERMHYFRVINLANTLGTETPISKMIRLDNVVPELSYNMQSGSSSYTSDTWTTQNVSVTLILTVGLSGGTYYHSRQESNVTPDSWEQLGTLSSGQGLTRPYSTAITVSGYHYFRLVNAGGDEDIIYASVKIDKTMVSISSVTAKKQDNTDYIFNSWTDGDIDLHIDAIISGLALSGVTLGYRETTESGEFSGAYTPITPNSDGKYVLKIIGNTVLKYQFTIRTGAGSVFVYASSVVVKIDTVVPVFETILTSDTPILDDGWYISDVELEYNLKTVGVSGCTYWYVYKLTTDSEYSTPIEVRGGDNINVTDISSNLGGGSVWDYIMYVRSGAGVFSQRLNPSSGTINIDKANYIVNVHQTLGNFEVKYSVLSGNVESLLGFKRGTVLSTNVSGLVSGAYIKKITKDGTDIASYTMDSKTIYHDNIVLQIQGYNPELSVEFYKEIEIVYGNLNQALQSTVTHCTASLSSSTQLPLGISGLSFSVKYNGSDSLPQSMGVYLLTYEINPPENSDTDWREFLIPKVSADEKTRSLVIRYFTNAGTQQAPYTISSTSELNYLKTYNSDENLDALQGQQRAQNAYYRQIVDLTLSVSVSQNLKNITFSGHYMGENKEIVLIDGGLFQKLTGSIENLGVRIETLTYSGQGSVGLLVGEASESSRISGCYAIGTIVGNVTVGYSLKVGGLVGTLKGTITRSYTDVKIILNAQGNGFSSVGGILGTFESSSTDLNFYDNYTTSTILVTSRDFTGVLDVGALIGTVSGDLNYTTGSGEILQSEYLAGNLILNSMSIDRALGNGIDNIDNDVGVAQAFEEFLANETVIGTTTITYSHRLVKSLARNKLASLVGSGTSSDPFIVASAEDLYLTEVFPWATFRQISDIVLLPSFSTLNIDIPFVGSYSAQLDSGEGAYAIYGLQITVDKEYNGLFGIIQGGKIENLMLIDVSIDIESSASVIYIGTVAGKITDGSVISGIGVSGDIKGVSKAINSKIFAGGIVGVAYLSEISSSIESLRIDIESPTIVAGGIVGWVDTSSANGLISTGTLNAKFSSSGYVGASVGVASGVIGDSVFCVSGALSANGASFDLGVGKTDNAFTVISTNYAQTIVGSSDINISGMTINNALGVLESYLGHGTAQSPYVISNYRELLSIKNHMYANYILNNDILIGDLDGNGSVDTKFDVPIGNTSIFTGVIDGAGHSIIGLTSPLFYTIAGQIRDVNLQVNLDIEYTGNEDIVIGTMAKYSIAGSNISSILVEGNIKLEVKSRAHAVIGGIIGIANGGILTGATIGAKITVKAQSLSIGGITGAMYNSSELKSAIILSPITADGASVNSGYAVGVVLSNGVTLGQSIDHDTNVMIVNGIKRNELVGKNPFKS